jgi:hypothetical protein
MAGPGRKARKRFYDPPSPMTQARFDKFVLGINDKRNFNKDEVEELFRETLRLRNAEEDRIWEEKDKISEQEIKT